MKTFISNRKLRLVSLMACLLAVASPVSAAGHEAEEPNIEDRFGIKPLSIRLVAGDHFLDFRYTVMDDGKARPLLDPKAKVFLLHEASGKALPVPATKLGSLRSTTDSPARNRVYTVLFSNQGKLARPGDDVTVVIGKTRIEHLRVDADAGGMPRIPAPNEERWKESQERLLSVYSVCAAECGRNRSCIEKCRKTYDFGSAHEYRRMIEIDGL